MPCSECDRLLGEVERRERHYTLASNTLEYRAGRAAQEEYVRLRSAVNHARVDSEVAAMELQQHKRLHA